MLDPEGVGWRWLQQCYNCVVLEAVQLAGAWSRSLRGDCPDKGTGLIQEKEAFPQNTEAASKEDLDVQKEEPQASGRPALEEIVEDCVRNGKPLLLRLDRLGWEFIRPLHSLIIRGEGAIYSSKSQ